MTKIELLFETYLFSFWTHKKRLIKMIWDREEIHNYEREKISEVSWEV